MPSIKFLHVGLQLFVYYHFVKMKTVLKEELICPKLEDLFVRNSIEILFGINNCIEKRVRCFNIQVHVYL